jgi:NMD protein affecting ribosome stability and mRNA decay
MPSPKYKITLICPRCGIERTVFKYAKLKQRAGICQRCATTLYFKKRDKRIEYESADEILNELEKK